jgi:NADPH-dependent 2,4-dienoyl-CoA reductase/sulfur reductase-like enzyme
MEQDEIWDATAAASYDSPGEGMFSDAVLVPTVEHLAGLAGSGAALEFAVGTGRVAIPLAARGVRVTGIELADGTVVPADVVVVGIGASPATTWLDGSGLDTSLGLLCDSRGATSAPGVFGVGDCSAWFDVARGHHHRVEHWTDSRDRARVMVEALLHGHDRSMHAELAAPYFWSDQYGVRLQFAGRRRGDETVTFETGTPEGADVLAVYWRDGLPVAVLGMNQPKLFNRWKRALASTPVAA